MFLLRYPRRSARFLLWKLNTLIRMLPLPLDLAVFPILHFPTVPFTLFRFAQSNLHPLFLPPPLLCLRLSPVKPF